MNKESKAMSSIEERVTRGLTLATWVVGTVWIAGTVVQVAVWLTILWLGGEAVYPFFGWTLGIGGTLVVTLLLLSLLARGIARASARSDRRPATQGRANHVDEDLL